MSKVLLWLPHGLHCQEFCQVYRPQKLEEMSKNEQQKFWEKIRSTPDALLARNPVERTKYVTIRNTKRYPKRYIVDQAFPRSGDGRIPLTQTVLDSGEVVLSCGDFQVEILPLFENLDILDRAGEFLQAAIQILDINVPTSDTLNLKPVYDLWNCWDDPKRMPQISRPAGIDNWIWDEFQRQQEILSDYDRQVVEYDRCKSEYDRLKAQYDQAMEKLKSDRRSKYGDNPPPWATYDYHLLPTKPTKPSAPQLPNNRPACFDALVRELNYDPRLSSALINTFPKISRNYTNRGLAATGLSYCPDSAFRNSANWANRSFKAKLTKPDWFGFLYPIASKRLERFLDRDLDNRAKVDLPLKQGRSLLAKLKPSKAIDSIEAALKEYFDSARTNADDEIAYFYATKKSFANSKYDLTKRSLATLVPSPAADQRERSVMGFLRAIDHWIWLGWTGIAPRTKSSNGQFEPMVRQFIKEHLELPEDGWRAANTWDQAIFKELATPQPMNTPPTTVSSWEGVDEDDRKPEVKEVDPQIQAKERRELQKAIGAAGKHKQTRLSADELEVLLFQTEFAAIKSNFSTMDMKRLYRSALNKLTRAQDLSRQPDGD